MMSIGLVESYGVANTNSAFNSPKLTEPLPSLSNNEKTYD